MKRLKLNLRSALKSAPDTENTETERRDASPGVGADAGGSEQAYSQRSAGASVTADGTDSGAQHTSGESRGSYDIDKGLTELYDALHDKLVSYGIKSVPTFEALYGLFESFLRPSIDEAIAERNRKAREYMAEIDADAYARGMGGSSYISSMKSRQQDAAGSDVIKLEGEYSASMAEYLYKALSAMQSIESDLERTRMTIQAQKEAALISAAARSSGSSSSSGSSRGSKSGKGSKSAAEEETAIPYSHNKNGSYFDGKWYAGDYSYLTSNATYNQYASYLNGLSPSERYLFFTSDQRTWRLRRWQVQYNLPQSDYNDLYSEFMTGGGSNSDTVYYYGPLGGVKRWQATPN